MKNKNEGNSSIYNIKTGIVMQLRGMFILQHFPQSPCSVQKITNKSTDQWEDSINALFPKNKNDHT